MFAIPDCPNCKVPVFCSRCRRENYRKFSSYLVKLFQQFTPVGALPALARTSFQCGCFLELFSCVISFVANGLPILLELLGRVCNFCVETKAAYGGKSCRRDNTTTSQQRPCLSSKKLSSIITRNHMSSLPFTAGAVMKTVLLLLRPLFRHGFAMRACLWDDKLFCNDCATVQNLFHSNRFFVVVGWLRFLLLCRANLFLQPQQRKS